MAKKSNTRSKRAAPKKAVAKKTRAKSKARIPKRGTRQEPEGFAFALTEGATFVPTTTVIPASVVPVNDLPSLLPTSEQSAGRAKTQLSRTTEREFSTLKSLKLGVSSAMDPRLQLALANYRTGKIGPTLASTAGDEIAVVARVKSADAWESMPDVDPGERIGKVSGGEWIVTGRIPMKRVEAVREQETVSSLKASQIVQRSLKATVACMNVAPASLPKNASPDGGSRAVVGIVDFGCDFAHLNFRQKNGKTRLLAIWNQSGKKRGTDSVAYGSVYSRSDIDSALEQRNPYTALGYGPSDEPGGTHGTHVMDIATGNGNGSGVPGVAPKSDIIFVEAGATDVAWQGYATVNSSFGDSVQMLEAVKFVFDRAGDRPCVCNISLGTNGGPHDGSTLVEQGMDTLLRDRPNRAIVIAAGNAQTDGIHTNATVQPGSPHLIEWRQQNSGGGELELWYPGERRLSVTLIAPDGTRFGPVQPGGNLPVGDANVVIFISSRLSDPNNGANVIGIWVAEGLSEDNYTVEVASADDKPVDYHAWLERKDRRQASFMSPVDTHTLGSLSTGFETIAVGSYDGHKPAFPLSTFSGRGPTRDGRNKPEVSAPGQFVWAAMSGSGDSVTKKSGTGMAAPAITGLIAFLLSEATRKGVALQISDIRNKLAQTASLDPPAIQAGGYDAFYGAGRANGLVVKI